MNTTKYQSRRQGAAAGFLSKEVLPSLNISAFLAWWGQGLLSCLPLRVRQLFWREITRLVLKPQGKGIRLYRERGETNEELGFYEGVGRWDENLREKDEVLVFRLPAEQLLSKPITLPLAAEENLRQVLAFEMERHTPFVANQVYYDFEVIERDPKARHIVVRLVVVPQRILNEWLERLSNWGLQPAVVDAGSASTSQINLLPEELRPSRSRTLPRINIVLVVLFIILAGAAVLLPLWQERSAVIALMPKVAAAQQKAEAVLSIRQQVEAANKASQFLVEKKLEFPSSIEFLYELTRLLPDGTWLQQLRLSRGELDIRGEATEASALISLLESSPYFQNVQFRSPVTTNARTGRDRFHITAKIPKLEALPL